MPIFGAVATLSNRGIRRKRRPVERFSEAAKAFINSFSGDKKYIDITNGSDSNNGDTDATAYQTLGYAQAQTAAINTAVMYVIKPGVYDLTPALIPAVTGSHSSVGLSDGGLPRTFFCAAGQVILQWVSGGRDCPMVNFENTNSAVYGAILKRDNNGKTLGYSIPMFNSTTAYSRGDFYNCVFQETNASGDWGLMHDALGANSGTANTLGVMATVVNNCSFYTTENAANDYTTSTNLVLNNSAFSHIWGANSASVRNNTVSAQTMDATTYKLTANNTTHGVHSGTYAWDAMWITFEVTGTVTITGLPYIGYELSASSSLYSPGGLHIRYQWNRDGVAISGAKSSTYTLVAADDGAVITNSVLHTNGRWTRGSLTTAGTASIAAAPQPPSTISYLVVAGGGSGGWQGGGGGAGGFRTGTSTPSGGTVYSIVVGAGSASSTSASKYPGYTGGTSSGFDLSATGGGGGGSFVTATHSWRHGGAGGSGGGGCGHASTATGGAGISGQGNAGGSVTVWTSTQKLSRGGGGAGAAAASGSGYTGINGGAGKYSSISGTNTAYAGGGGGHNSQTTGNYGGGIGGGGTGGSNGTQQAIAGGINLGGGGGGGKETSGAGGSGVVIISYADTSPAATVTGNPTVTIVGGNRIYKFTSSGSITW